MPDQGVANHSHRADLAFQRITRHVGRPEESPFKKPSVNRRFAFPNIEDGGPDTAFRQGLMERLRFDHGAARRIEKDGHASRAGQAGLIEEMKRRIGAVSCQGHMKRQDIGIHERFKWNVARVACRPGQGRIIEADLQPEGFRRTGHFASDGADADDAE